MGCYVMKINMLIVKSDNEGAREGMGSKRGKVTGKKAGKIIKCFIKTVTSTAAGKHIRHRRALTIFMILLHAVHAGDN